MTRAEQIARDACDYLFRVGRHSDNAVEFDPVGYLRARIDEAVKSERASCQELAARYGGHDADAIAELIGQRNFKR